MRFFPKTFFQIFASVNN